MLLLLEQRERINTRFALAYSLRKPSGNENENLLKTKVNTLINLPRVFICFDDNRNQTSVVVFTARTNFLLTVKRK